MSDKRRTFHVVVAATKDNGIGKDGSIPWHIKADMAHFREITTRAAYPHKQNVVIMGRKTWGSLPRQFRPLPNRINVVLSKSVDKLQGAIVARSLDEALNMFSDDDSIESVFVIGGGHVYEEAMKSDMLRDIFMTRIGETFDCDTFFPEIDESKFLTVSQSQEFHENNLDFYFVRYVSLK